MSQTCKTVRIKSTHPKTQGDFVEINETDFDPQIHTLYAGKTPSAPPPAVSEKPAAQALGVDSVYKQRIEPAAQALADDAGVDVSGLAGSGKKGLVTVADVENFLETLTTGE